MGKKLPPQQMELYRRTDEVLHYIWDPIGVAGAPGARDEYETYLPKVFRLLVDGAGSKELADYLLSVEREWMEIRGRRGKALEVAETLIGWREWVTERDS